MTDVEVLYIAIGLVTSLLFSEVLGLAPGGIIVPGYLAMYANEDTRGMKDDVRAAVAELFKRGATRGLVPSGATPELAP